MEDKGYTREQVLSIAENALGKTMGELNNYKSKADSYNKGSFGHIFEEDVYQYNINSKSAPDFEHAGIELKVTPYRRNKNGSLSAKERLVLNIINYMEEYKHDFYHSHFWFKNKLIEIIWYLWEEGKAKDELKVTDSLLFSFPAEDLPIIKHDWEFIVNKIKNGKAHELSEADTMYLGACTKGANSKSVREQPFSLEYAKQRAFCLKTSYMTQLVRQYIGHEKAERININNEESFEDSLIRRLEKYYGLTVADLKEKFNVETNAKNLNEVLVTRMLGVKGKLSNTDEFIKANIVLKTIRIKNNGRIVESMSFPTFKFEKIINEEWEESDLYQMFYTTKFMFALFEEDGYGNYHFTKIKFWNMPMTLLNSNVKSVWQKTVDVIKAGNIVKEIKNNNRITNFPGMSDNDYCHVRPHAQNSHDVYPLPVTDKLTGLNDYTKHCFWLNNKFIVSIINK